jgi:hypothetical protein
VTLQSHFQVIVPDMRHLGESPLSVEGIAFAGRIYQAVFNLPQDLAENEYSYLQCRTLHNQVNNKKFFINSQLVENFLEPHPIIRTEWILEGTVIPKGWLKPGENSLIVGFADENVDDFIIDDIVLWYKTTSS